MIFIQIAIILVNSFEDSRF